MSRDKLERFFRNSLGSEDLCEYSAALEAAIAEAAAQERERCAVLCERIASVCEQSSTGVRQIAAVAAAESCARLIRSGR